MSDPLPRDTLTDVPLVSGVSTSLSGAVDRSVVWYWASSRTKVDLFLWDEEDEEEYVEDIAYDFSVVLELSNSCSPGPQRTRENM